MKLQIDLTEADVSRPILQDGIIEVQIVEVSVAESKNVPGNYNLVVDFHTVNNETSNKGKDIRAGHKLRRWFPLQQSKNPDAPDFRDDLARLFDAAFNNSDPANRPQIEEPSDFLVLAGKFLKIRVASEDAGERGVQNVIKGMFPVA